MSGFQFDTSGVVAPFHRYDPQWNTEAGGYRWSDLSPFVQGYGTEMARALYALLVANGASPEAANQAVAFQNWAPETLARIMEDCKAALEDRRLAYHPTTTGARLFWSERQKGLLNGDTPRFPPLTPYLGDDGKVYLREAS